LPKLYGCQVGLPNYWSCSAYISVWYCLLRLKGINKHPQYLIRLRWLRQSWGFAGTVFEDAPRGRVCVRVFIGMSERALWVSPMYCVIRKKTYQLGRITKSARKRGIYRCWINHQILNALARLYIYIELHRPRKKCNY
jgi:hypothetical protein